MRLFLQKQLKFTLSKLTKLVTCWNRCQCDCKFVNRYWHVYLEIKFFALRLFLPEAPNMYSLRRKLRFEKLTFHDLAVEGNVVVYIFCWISTLRNVPPYRFYVGETPPRARANESPARQLTRAHDVRTHGGEIAHLNCSPLASPLPFLMPESDRR